MMLSLTIFDYTYAKIDMEILESYPRKFFKDIQLFYSSFICMTQITCEFFIIKYEIKQHYYQGIDQYKCTWRNRLYWVPLLFFSLSCLCHPNYLCEYYLGKITEFTIYNEIT